MKQKWFYAAQGQLREKFNKMYPTANTDWNCLWQVVTKDRVLECYDIYEPGKEVVQVLAQIVKHGSRAALLVYEMKFVASN